MYILFGHNKQCGARRNTVDWLSFISSDKFSLLLIALDLRAKCLRMDWNCWSVKYLVNLFGWLQAANLPLKRRERKKSNSYLLLLHMVFGWLFGVPKNSDAFIAQIIQHLFNKIFRCSFIYCGIIWLVIM